MNQLLEWSPLVVFFLIFKLFGIYWATASLMLSTVAVMCAYKLRTGRYKPMHVVTAAVVLGLGTATLILHDKRFIQWKPTLLMGIAAGAFLASSVVGAKPLARRLLEGLFSEPLKVSPAAWQGMNAAWAGYCLVLALANLYIVENFSENVWVNFKVWGMTVALLLFMLPQVVWLHGKTRPPLDMSGSRENRLREKLVAHFAPLELQIEDQSHLHAGHAGAATGLSHFRIRIVAEAFRGHPAVARHRMIYGALGEMLKTDIHAIAIEALPPVDSPVGARPSTG